MTEEFLSDADAPEGFTPVVKPRGARLPPTDDDRRRMAQPREEVKLYVLGDTVPVGLRGRISPEPITHNAIPQAESLAGIEKVLAANDTKRRQKMEDELQESSHQRLMRELLEIQKSRAPKVEAPEEVKSDDGEKQEQARSADEEPAERVRVATKAPARRKK